MREVRGGRVYYVRYLVRVAQDKYYYIYTGISLIYKGEISK
jgi:hypothetical protein